jgi:hypothetical protein
VEGDAGPFRTLAAIRGGRSVPQVTAELGLPDRLVRSWLSWADERALTVSGAVAPTPRREQAATARRAGPSPADQAAEIGRRNVSSLGCAWSASSCGAHLRPGDGPQMSYAFIRQPWPVWQSACARRAARSWSPGRPQSGCPADAHYGALGAPPPPPFPTHHRQHPRLPRAPNLLERNVTAAAPDRVWLADITYVWTREGWLYLAVVLDLFSRRVVGGAMADHLGHELALAASRRRLSG